MKKSEKYHEYKRPGESVNPYKGLDSYEKEDKDRFFGREMEKKELFRLVRLNLNTLVIGKSGIGKTSLLNAGLFPQLEGSGFFPIRLRLNYLLSESDLMGKVRNVIGDALKRYSIRGSDGNETVVGIKCGETLWEYFHRVRHQDEMGNKFITPVLVFDQFEEIFTRGKNHPCIIELIDELYWLIENQVPEAFQELILEGQKEFPYLDSRPDVRVIISLREDYLPHLIDLKSRLPSIDKVTFRVKHMQKDQAEAEEPGKKRV